MDLGISAGELDRRVQMQTVVMTSDAEGVSGENWSTVQTVWAHISPLSSQERFQAAQTEEKISHKVVIRWRNDVTPKMRLLYNGRIFIVKGILDPDENHVRLDCLCEEIVTVARGQD